MAKELNKEQKRAVEYIEGPLLVLAGPGTGKTQLLSSKVAHILQTTDTLPENILCITFTEPGAQNMRERLASIIGAIPASKVNIHTYHAFGSDILFKYKNYAENFNRNLESPIDDVTAFKIIKNIQKSLPASDILRGDQVNDIKDTISSAKAARLTSDDLKKIAEKNLADSEVLSEQISPYLENLIPRKVKENLDNVYYPIHEILKNFQNLPPLLRNVERNISGISKDLAIAISESEETGKITPLSSWKDSYFEKTENNSYRLKDRIANKKLSSLAKVMESYENYLEENGLFDFNDMIEEAINALKTNTGFRLTLSEQYQFILLDEFQDTNPSQFEIIKLLTDYEKPCIMAVGDDDQAIYEFQGASASILSTFKNHYDAKIINLVTNYRSTQDILDFSKKIIDQVDDSFAKTEPGIEKTLTAFFEKPGKIERHEFISSDAEYYWLSEKIAQLIKSGVHQKDIAIIAPKHKYITPLLPYLKSKKEINIAYERRENVLENQKIHELIILAKFIFETSEGRNASNLLPEILSFPFWNLSPLSVVEVISEARYDKKSILNNLDKSEDEKLKSVANFFAALIVKSFDTPIETFFNYLLGTTELNGFKSPFLDFYSKNETSFETFELYENLSTLRSTIRNHLKNESPKLKDLIELINDYESASMPLMSASPYQDSSDSVQILSAHKSKGLEFENVFLIAADHVSWGKGKGNNNMLSLPKNLQFIRHTGATDGERLRLLFVAATRARSNLYISNSLKDFNGKSPARLEYLNEFEKDNILLSPFIPKDKEKIIKKHYDDLDSNKLKTDLSISWLDIYKTLSPDIKSIYKSRVENFRLSASALTSFIDIVYAGPEDFFKNSVLKAPREPETKQLAFGNLIHKVYEKITKEKISDESAIEFFRTEALKEDIEPEILKEILEKGPEDLAISLKSFGENLRAPFTHAEVNLAPEKITFESIPLTGKIDHIRIDEEEKTIEIIDFKTGNYKDGKWNGSSDTLFKYMLQLNFYKLLLNLSPTYKKYKIERAHIYFVTPDKDGEVHDKVYEFNSTDELLLTKLIPAIYGHMTSLDFLDIPDLCPKKNNSKTLKDIKNFIEIL